MSKLFMLGMSSLRHPRSDIYNNKQQNKKTGCVWIGFSGLEISFPIANLQHTINICFYRHLLMCPKFFACGSPALVASRPTGNHLIQDKRLQSIDFTSEPKVLSMPASPGVQRRRRDASVLAATPQNLFAPKIRHWFIGHDIFCGRATIHKSEEMQMSWLLLRACSESKFNPRARLGGGCNYHDNEV